MITMKQLRYFDALADCLHFGQAAQRCHVTQPALSMQIKELEEHLRVALIERHHQGAVLTPEGEEIARRCKIVLTEVSDLVDFAHHQRSLLTGSLRVGVIPSIAPYLLPKILPELRERFPELELAVRETQTRNLIREVLETQLDVAIVALPIEEAEIEELALFEDRFHVAIASGHSLAELNRVPHARLADEKLLLLEEGHCLRDQALSFCSALGAKQQMDEFGATSLATIVQMVASGYGVTLLPEMALPVEVRDTRSVQVRPFENPCPSRTIGLVWRRTSPRRADYAELAKTIIDVARPR